VNDQLSTDHGPARREDRSAFFSVREPEAAETPVVVEVPHAGLYVDPPSLAFIEAPVHALGRDADLLVDDLFADAPLAGASLLVARVSRYVCDLNRSERDVDALTVQGAEGRASPHGLIWRTTTDALPAIARPLPHAELERRLALIYRPYHATLRRLLEAKRKRFGFAVLLCGHSMPSRGRPSHSDPGHERADVVPGSRGRTSAAPAVIELAECFAREQGWSVAHDDPYRGGFSTEHYGRPGEGVHALQVELARRLYMNEAELTKKPRAFEETRAACRTLVARLGELELA
jgi:N-formylglutamate amidohydrolase